MNTYVIYGTWKKVIDADFIIQKLILFWKAERDAFPYPVEFLDGEKEKLVLSSMCLKVQMHSEAENVTAVVRATVYKNRRGMCLS